MERNLFTPRIIKLLLLIALKLPGNILFERDFTWKYYNVVEMFASINWKNNWYMSKFNHSSNNSAYFILICFGVKFITNKITIKIREIFYKNVTFSLAFQYYWLVKTSEFGGKYKYCNNVK